MRVTLERLAEAAQTHNLPGEERRALEHLVRLVPFDQSYHERLQELGDAPAEDAEESATWYEPPVEEKLAAPSPSPLSPVPEVPSFENIIERGGDDRAELGSVYVAAGSASEFEWNSVAEPELKEQPEERAGVVTIDPNSSFADLNEDLAGARTSRSAGASSASAMPFDAADHGVDGSFEDVPLAPKQEASDDRVKALLAQELESVDYYLAQGYSDIARDTLDMLERQYGVNEDIAIRRRQLPHAEDGGFAMPSNAANAVVVEDAPAQFENFAPIEETLVEEVEIGEQMFFTPPENAVPPVVVAKPAAAPQEEAAVTGLHSELADMFEEFRDEDEANAPAASTGDYETHYNTGLAYREMGMLDQAVEELQAAIALVAPHDGTARYLQCCNLLGHCFMQKNMPRPAAMWFKKGMDTPGHTEDEYQALRYELGTAYEQMGDLERAIEIFSEVYGMDVNYRGVGAKLRDLQAIRK
jgi:tetratricopeptide (TPR) repeat protein